MKILIDIGHPAHVHYFKNFIWKMEANGHEFLIVARDKEISHQLLNQYKIPFVSRGKGKNNMAGKLLYTIKADWLLLFNALMFRPHLFLSFGSPYAAHVSWILRKNHIAITDTEHANFGILAFLPFTSTVLTPDVFYRDLGKKQHRFNSYMEYSYLHPNYFSPDIEIKKQLGLFENEKFVLFRFISWKASHDIGQKGISENLKMELIDVFLRKGFKIFISSEAPLDEKIENYKLNIAPDKIHSVICEASFFIGESGTMATEAAILGTPSVYVNTLNAGVFEDEVKHGILYSFRSDKGLLKKINELLNIEDIKKQHQQKARELLLRKIDITSFLVHFIENFPSSKIDLQKKYFSRGIFL